jgi:hypothetical protein
LEGYDCHSLPDIGLKLSTMKDQRLCDSEFSPSLSSRQPSRKRSRCCTSLLVFAVAAATLMYPVSSFLVVSKTPTSLSDLQSSRSSVTERVKPLVPKSSSTQKRREEAVKAMKRTKVETALDGVDAQMLELLSGQFLYPDNKSSEQESKKTRPRGRPDCVPGAMKFETMIKFQEQKGIMGVARDSYSESTKSPQMNDSSNDNSSAQARKPGKVRGSASGSTDDSLPEETGGNKRRKRVVKNLPRRKDPSRETHAPERHLKLKGKAKASNLELQKYYRTELLNAEEEYTLGMQIQLMVKCEQVHEGLAMEVMRIPTIQEWAQACG